MTGSKCFSCPECQAQFCVSWADVETTGAPTFCPFCGYEFTAEKEAEARDICGLCGLPGANKIPQPVYWPGERRPTEPLVHTHCENAECARAHACLTDKEREAFLRTI